MENILVIDAHDSFVYNLVELLRSTRRCHITIARPEECETFDLAPYSGLLLSPGPGLPQDYPAMLRLISQAIERGLPTLGVCLGLQAIAWAMGGRLVQLAPPQHGCADGLKIVDPTDPIVGCCPSSYRVGRYHSWAVDPKQTGEALRITAVSPLDGAILAMRHSVKPIFGLQFHPESYITTESEGYIARWLDICSQLNYNSCGAPLGEEISINLPSSRQTESTGKINPTSLRSGIYPLNTPEDKRAYIQQLNALGRMHTPFFFTVNYEQNEAILSIARDPLPGLHYSFEESDFRNEESPSSETLSKPPCSSPQFECHPIPYEEYSERFDIIQQSLRHGDSFLANLTVATPIETSLNLQEIYTLARAPYRMLMEERFVCFSPERFVRIDPQRISTNPMKGTIPADQPNAASTILQDPKETAEHYTIVDLMRSDLARVSHNVRVARFRYIDRIITRQRELLQVSSEIEGKLPENALNHLGDILFRLLPAGSICGAPKEATLQAIARAEQGHPRGYYTGIFGYFNGQVLDSAVMIRFIAKHPDGSLYYHSGGGITIHSDPLSEYHEVYDKIYLPF